MNKTKRFYIVKERTYDRGCGQLIDEDDRDGFCFAILELMKINRKLHRLNELACNGWPKEIEETRDGKFYRYNVEDTTLQEKSEKKTEELETRAKELSKKHGFEIRIQHDPRGSAIKLSLVPDDRTDCYGSDTDLIL